MKLTDLIMKGLDYKKDQRLVKKACLEDEQARLEFRTNPEVVVIEKEWKEKRITFDKRIKELEEQLQEMMGVYKKRVKSVKGGIKKIKKERREAIKPYTRKLTPFREEMKEKRHRAWESYYEWIEAEEARLTKKKNEKTT